MLYFYDADGNLIQKNDARGVVTYFGYDVLHRLTSKGYSDGTPAVSYVYETTPMWGIDVTNTIGRLVLEGTPTTQRVYSYDAMGRVVDQWECLPSNCGSGAYQTHFAYDLAGNPTSITYPGLAGGGTSGFTLTYSYNAANRVNLVTSSLNDAQHPGTLGSAFSYHPHGALKQMTLGNGLAQADAYNNRLQPTELRTYYPSTGANTLKLNYGFDSDPASGVQNNGNVASWAAVGQQVFSRSYTYDELNRLKTMTGTGGSCTGLSWTYDVWGNRTAQSVTGGTCPAPSTPVNNKNQLIISGYSYDAAGNLVAEPGKTYQYDAENRMKSINNGSIASYVYDAGGRRVQKTVGTTVTEYLYSPYGEVFAERQASAPAGWTVSYIYLNGQLLAQYKDNTTYFAHKDHLGSTRLLTKVDRSVQECIDYLPFGEQASGACVSSGSPTTTHKFTGQERDGESNLDYFKARHFAYTMGRFVQVDPVALSPQKMKDPQQLNMYSYGRNNPLRFVDPNGEEVNVASLSEEDRNKLIAELEKDSGLDLDYNAETGNLDIVGQGAGGSETFRTDLTDTINSDQVYNVVNQSTYQGQQVDFGLFDKKTNTVVIDFNDVQKVPDVKLGLVFYHETIGHGHLGLPDEGGSILRGFETAVSRTARVGQELFQPYPTRHDLIQRGEKYFIRVADPTLPRKFWGLGGMQTRDVDITDVKNRQNEPKKE